MADIEIVTKQIGESTYVLKMIPTMAALHVMQRLERDGLTPDVIFDVVSKGAALGSVSFTQKKFDEHFAGKLKDLMELITEVLRHNNLIPLEEGNSSDSEE